MNEEFEEDPSEEYVRAYNEGYQMARFEPKLIDEILKSHDKKLSNNFFTGLEQGKNKYLHEKRIADLQELQAMSKNHKKRIK